MARRPQHPPHAMTRPRRPTGPPGAVAALALVATLAACTAAPPTLSEAGLYASIADKTVVAGAIAFEPRFVLWSDGAEKQRWAIFPEGGVIDSSDMDAWVFPDGTRLFKEFRRDGRRVETRMLSKDAGVWTSATYVWNDDETDAGLAWFFGQQDVRGTAHDVPGATSCTFCHGDAERPLGFTALQLARPATDNGDNEGDNEGDNDASGLDALVAAGRLSHAPAAPLVVPGDDVDQRALGVLHVNCGSCHADTGSQSDLPLRFRLRSDALDSVDDTGAVRTAVGRQAEDEIDGLRTYLHPGDPDQSLVLRRMSTRGSGVQMPPVGSEDVDDDGVAAVRAFIERRR